MPLRQELRTPSRESSGHELDTPQTGNMMTSNSESLVKTRVTAYEQAMKERSDDSSNSPPKKKPAQKTYADLAARAKRLAAVAALAATPGTDPRTKLEALTPGKDLQDTPSAASPFTTPQDAKMTTPFTPARAAPDTTSKAGAPQSSPAPVVAPTSTLETPAATRVARAGFTVASAPAAVQPSVLFGKNSEPFKPASPPTQVAPPSTSAPATTTTAPPPAPASAAPPQVQQTSPNIMASEANKVAAEILAKTTAPLGTATPANAPSVTSPTSTPVPQAALAPVKAAPPPVAPTAEMVVLASPPRAAAAPSPAVKTASATVAVDAPVAPAPAPAKTIASAPLTTTAGTSTTPTVPDMVQQKKTPIAPVPEASRATPTAAPPTAAQAVYPKKLAPAALPAEIEEIKVQAPPRIRRMIIEAEDPADLEEILNEERIAHAETLLRMRLLEKELEKLPGFMRKKVQDGVASAMRKPVPKPIVATPQAATPATTQAIPAPAPATQIAVTPVPAGRPAGMTLARAGTGVLASVAAAALLDLVAVGVAGGLTPGGGGLAGMFKLKTGREVGSILSGGIIGVLVEEILRRKNQSPAEEQHGLEQVGDVALSARSSSTTLMIGSVGAAGCLCLGAVIVARFLVMNTGASPSAGGGQKMNMRMLGAAGPFVLGLVAPLAISGIIRSMRKAQDSETRSETPGKSKSVAISVGAGVVASLGAAVVLDLGAMLTAGFLLPQKAGAGPAAGGLLSGGQGLGPKIGAAAVVAAIAVFGIRKFMAQKSDPANEEDQPTGKKNISMAAAGAGVVISLVAAAGLDLAALLTAGFLLPKTGTGAAAAAGTAVAAKKVGGAAAAAGGAAVVGTREVAILITAALLGFLVKAVVRNKMNTGQKENSHAAERTVKLGKVAAAA